MQTYGSACRECPVSSPTTPPNMQKISIVTDRKSKAAAIRQQLDGTFELTFSDFGRIQETESSDRVLFDVELANGSRAVELKHRLKRNLQHRTLIFIIDKASHLEAIRATALGATAILHRPFHRQQLIEALLRDVGPLMDGPNDPIRSTPGMGKARDALRGIFEAACVGAPLDAAAIDAAGEAVILRMEEHGLGSWVSAVRKHRSQTYQHCLIVTGITVAFAQHLGFRRADQLQLSFGAMLHDIGKARIPLAILEKPSALSPDEMALMSKHPEYGLDALKDTSGFKKDLLDLVVHHHEYLDGSGYPHRLRGSEISDLVRSMTICDIFGALVETRAYRPALPADSAYQILLDMGDKLDRTSCAPSGSPKPCVSTRRQKPLPAKQERCLKAGASLQSFPLPRLILADVRGSGGCEIRDRCLSGAHTDGFLTSLSVYFGVEAVGGSDVDPAVFGRQIWR